MSNNTYWMIVTGIDNFNITKDNKFDIQGIDYSNRKKAQRMIKNDRMTMAHSIEARVPFTDNELVSFLNRVSPSIKMKNIFDLNIDETVKPADIIRYARLWQNII